MSRCRSLDVKSASTLLNPEVRMNDSEAGRRRARTGTAVSMWERVSMMFKDRSNMAISLWEHVSTAVANAATVVSQSKMLTALLNHWRC